MYMFMEYIFVILVVRLIKMTIDLDYCNIFFNVNNKKLRWILCIGVYLAAVLADIIFDSEFISIMESFIIMYIIMQAYSGALDKKVLFASMNVALECIADMGTSYIMSDGIVSIIIMRLVIWKYIIISQNNLYLLCCFIFLS